MDNEQLKKIIGNLQNHSHDVVVHSLKYLRNKYIKKNCDADTLVAFCECGGVTALSSLLFSAHNEDIFDFTLSILGNSCVESAESRKQVVTAGVIKAIGRILDSLEKQSIVDRACRLLGNLTKDSVSYTSIGKDLNVITSVVNYLKSAIEAKNIESVKNAIRTLRYIVKISDECRDELTDQNIVVILTPVLSSLVKQLYEPVLLFLSEYCSFSPGSKLQNQIATSSLLPSLVKFTVNSSTSKYVALSLLVNFAIDLPEPAGKAGAIPIIVSATNNENISGHIEKSKLIEAICSFVHHACNRIRLNKCNGLECLIRVLNCDYNDDLKSMHDTIVKALLHCLYDETSMPSLQEMGIIPLLLVQLSNFIEDKKGQHSLDDVNKNRRSFDLSKFDVCHSDIQNLLEWKKQESSDDDSLCHDEDKAEVSTATNKNKVEYSVNSPSYKMILVNQVDGDENFPKTSGNPSNYSNLFAASSPSSLSSMSLSPSTSPSHDTYLPLGFTSPVSPSSPMSIASDTSLWSDDFEGYVYSDHDDDGEMLADDNSGIKQSKSRRATTDFKNWSRHKRKKIEESNAECYTPKRKKSSQSKSPTNDQQVMDSIFTILAKFTWKVNDRPIPTYVHAHVRNYFEIFFSFIRDLPMERTVVKYGHSVRPFYSACKTLCRISSDPECIQTIVLCEIPSLIKRTERRLQHADKICEQCYIIRNLCKKIVTQDLKMSFESRIGLSKLYEISLCRDNKLRLAHSLCIVVSSSDVLRRYLIRTNVLNDLVQSLKDSFDDSFASLSNLAKNVGIACKRDERYAGKSISDCIYDDYERDVKFQLSNGAIVGANKLELSKKSDFFRAMFSGGFNETDKSVVSLEDACSSEVFSSLMHYLHCGQLPCTSTSNSLYNVNILMNLLTLADKYLLFDLHLLLRSMIEERVDVDNVVDVFRLANTIQDQLLEDFTIKFILTKTNAGRSYEDDFLRSLKQNEIIDLASTAIDRIIRRHLAS